MQSNKTCPILEQYLNYLTIIKGRSNNTILEYRIDLLYFLKFISEKRRIPQVNFDFSCIDITFIKSISINDMYSFISYCQTNLNSSAGTRARKIVSIRQFWKYLNSKAHLLDSNIAEELETPKLPKRIPKYLTLEESVRLLIECKSNSRDNCIITIFLNCALRLSELANLNINQVNTNILSVIGKGNKERKIFLTPAAQKSLATWLQIRNTMDVPTNALFISRNKQRLTTRSIQNVIKKYVIKAGLNPENISTHKLRHTSATLMYKYGHVDDSLLQSAVNSNPLALMFN